MANTTHYRTCPFCEATCGLALEVSPEGRVESIRGDSEDALSAGFLCPKAFGLKELREDPDRLRAPLVRRDGELREATWPEAFAAVEAGLADRPTAHTYRRARGRAPLHPAGDGRTGAVCAGLGSLCRRARRPRSARRPGRRRGRP